MATSDKERDVGVKRVGVRLTPVVLYVTGVLGVLLATLLLSPLLLILVDQMYSSFPWERLSNVGQSYSGMSALLSAGALVAVAVSIRSQNRQIHVAQLQAVQDVQIRIFEMAMGDKTLAAALEGVEDLSTERFDSTRRHRFRVLYFRFIQLAFLLGEYNENGLRAAMTQEFESVGSRTWWGRVRRAWYGEATSKRMNRFNTIVDEEWRKSSEA